MNNFSKILTDITVLESNFQERRDYFSLSNSVSSIDELVNDYLLGYHADEKGRLKCYKGYQMEADLKRRIKKAFPESYADAPEISAFDGLVKGHPDFMLRLSPDFVCDCKSVLKDEWLPVSYQALPYRVKMQMQAYMHFGNYAQALVVYESRESGLISHYILKRDSLAGADIEMKFRQAINKAIKL